MEIERKKDSFGFHKMIFQIGKIGFCWIYTELFGLFLGYRVWITHSLVREELSNHKMCVRVYVLVWVNVIVCFWGYEESATRLLECVSRFAVDVPVDNGTWVMYGLWHFCCTHIYFHLHVFVIHHIVMSLRTNHPQSYLQLNYLVASQFKSL